MRQLRQVGLAKAGGFRQQFPNSTICKGLSLDLQVPALDILPSFLIIHCSTLFQVRFRQNRL